MAKTQKKKVQMPAGIRNKLMAAVAMLLVSSIMVVSSTYAWFTLSTAPEVTGITTSVGANGNLEMALLNTDTYNHLDSITSAVGDSSAVQGSVKANTTWGNLVDLSDASYGLSTINLQPAAIRITGNKTDNAGPLATPIYGADGRVGSVDGRTYTSGTFASGSWSFAAGSPTYGVRAIGANDNLTPQQAGLLAAKAAYNTNLNSAKATIQSALATNGADMASAITNLAMQNASAALTDGQKTAISNMVTASENALKDIDAAYKQVLLAATSVISDSVAYDAASSAVSSAPNYNAAVTALTGMAELNGQNFAVPPALSTAAATLETQKTAVSNAKSAIAPASEGASVADDNYKTALSKLVKTDNVTVNGYKVGTPNAETGETYDDYLVQADGNLNSNFISKAFADNGVIVEMPDGSGVFAYIGKAAGNYSASCTVSINYGGMSVNNMPATMKTVAAVDATVSGALNNIQASGTSTGATALSDTYGYALDFAFRTNAAGSKLQLQTAAAQRVYSDGTSEVTQGSGSNMTFKSLKDEHNNPYLSDAQVAALMSAIHVAFINPDTGDIYGIAALENITTSGDGMKGDLVLKNYTSVNTYTITLTDKTDDATKDDIMDLPQNTATKLTAIVWLDGNNVDNGDVANAAQSITGSMNLQFSSSVKLQPMQNTAMKNGSVEPAATTTPASP